MAPVAGGAPACAECGALEAPFLCSRCRSANFCSPACQRASWPKHKLLCAAAVASTVAGPAAPAAPPAPATAAPATAAASTASTAAASAAAAEGSSASSTTCLAPHHDGEWVGIVNVDAFPGEDVGVVREGDEAARALCLRRGCGGFVTWRGTAFLRARPSAELAARAQYSVGSTLWLPSSALARGPAALRDLTLPADLPEVVLAGARPVDKCKGLPQAAMDDRFARSVPVVLTDAQEGWPAIRKWSFEFFGQRYGDEEVPCSDLAPFFQEHDRGKMLTVRASLREFSRYVLGEPNAIRPLQRSLERPFYANSWTPFMKYPELLADVSDRLYCVQDSVPRVEGPGPAKEFNCSLTKIFMGPAGTVSRLHHDTYATHVWLSQIRGRKQFIVFPPDDWKFLHCAVEDECFGRTSLFNPEAPDYDAFPEARHATAYSVVVEEGETVVLPSKWWHWAKSLTPSVTLMRNFVNEGNLREHFQIRESVQKAKIERQQRMAAEGGR